jgi:hypothetical protein
MQLGKMGKPGVYWRESWAAPVMAAIKVSFRALPPQIDTHQFSI